MTELLWAIAAVLAVLLAPATGIACQHVTRDRNQQPGEER